MAAGWFGSHRVLCGGQIATQSQIPEGRILNMLEVPVQRTTKMLDAPPIEMDLNGNRVTGDDFPAFALGELARAHFQHGLAFYFDRS